jgi:ssDNA-binding Zn-finger/Zn-ribbon topoisomerase 1
MPAAATAWMGIRWAIPASDDPRRKVGTNGLPQATRRETNGQQTCHVPACDFTTFHKPLADKFCPECGYPLGENRLGRRLLGLKCTNKACKTNAEKPEKKEPIPLAEAA